MVLFLLLGMLMYGSLIYLTNQDAMFISIPHSFWWAIVTMTTGRVELFCMAIRSFCGLETDDNQFT